MTARCQPNRLTERSEVRQGHRRQQERVSHVKACPPSQFIGDSGTVRPNAATTRAVDAMLDELERVASPVRPVAICERTSCPGRLTR